MAVFREDYLDIDLNSGSVNRTFTARMIGEGDQNGNAYGVRVFKDNAPVSLSDVTWTGKQSLLLEHTAKTGRG